MSNASTLTTQDQLTVDQWLQIRKDEGLKIDPETAVVWWKYADPLNPYGVYPDPPEEECQIGRVYFARSPGCKIWVSFHDLPAETLEKFGKGTYQKWKTILCLGYNFCECCSKR